MSSESNAVFAESAINDDMEGFIKDYYQDKFEEYRPKHMFFKEPRFLVVEDDLTYQPLWDFILRKIDKDFSYDWSTNVADAEIQIRKALSSNHPYDLIISDIFLAGKETGLDLWKRHGLVYNNMVLVSSIGYEQLVKDLKHEIYIPPYLKKPLDVQEAVKTINKSLLMSYF